MSARGERAEQLHRMGYNCAQAVLLAFEDRIPIDVRTGGMLASPFGAGMGGMREVCGAFSGALMVLGFIEGNRDPADRKAKAEVYAKAKELGARFEKINGSLICGELLGMRKKVGPDGREVPLSKRPCSAMVHSAADMMAEYLGEE